jgi:hypothetical protein
MLNTNFMIFLYSYIIIITNIVFSKATNDIDTIYVKLTWARIIDFIPLIIIIIYQYFCLNRNNSIFKTLRFSVFKYYTNPSDKFI